MPWYPQRKICFKAMEQAALDWRYGQLHEDAPFHDGTFPEDPADWSATRTTATPYHYLDGVSLWVSQHDLTPEDKFLGARPDQDDDPDD